jgi:hypothetical protein
MVSKIVQLINAFLQKYRDVTVWWKNKFEILRENALYFTEAGIEKYIKLTVASSRAVFSSITVFCSSML